MRIAQDPEPAGLDASRLIELVAEHAQPGMGWYGNAELETLAVLQPSHPLVQRAWTEITKVIEYGATADDPAPDDHRSDVGDGVELDELYDVDRRSPHVQTYLAVAYSCIPSEDVVARLVAAATNDDPDFGMFVRLAAVTGARRGEVCALRWPDIDFTTATLTVARALIDVGGAVTEKPTKTDTARRIALDRRTVDILTAHQAAQEQRAEAIGTRLDRDGFVCSHAADGSKPLRPDQASSRFRHLTRQLGAPQVRLHDLRHFAAAHLLAAGIPVETVSGRLGHSNPATTLATYSQFRPVTDQQAAGILTDVLNQHQ